MSAGRARLPLALLLLGALAACAGGRPVRYRPRPGPYDGVPAPALDHAQRARLRAEHGDLEGALALLAPLAAAHPRSLPLARMHQDLVLAAEGEPGRERLHAAALARLGEEPDVPALLLAARLEPDPKRARSWIDRAAELDPASAWPPYAAAHLAARQGDWSRAREDVARALERDPGLLPARRLEAALVARGGAPEEAVGLLRGWLEVAAQSPFVASAERLDARLDLARLLVLAGAEKEALELLEELPDEPAASGRGHAIVAAAEQALGRPGRALDAAREAQRRAPDEALPLVQEALLEEAWLGDPQAARAAWQRVLELARQRGDLGAMILAMRARVALERARAGDPALAP